MTNNKQTPIEKAIDLIDGFLTELDDIAENNKQQTAVEQFLNAIKDQILLSKEHLEMIESYADQCKEMEKERIETAYNKGTVHGIDYPESTLPITGEQYYNETYGGCEQ